MPNWSYNTTEITGDTETIAKFRTAIEATRDTTTFSDDEGYSLLRTFIPRPESVEKDGTCYDWSLNHWGTKWEDDNRMDDTDRRILLIGQTAWAPPINGYMTVSTMFPTLTFTLGYQEESAAFVGAMTFRNGEVLAKREVDDSDPEMPAMGDEEDDWERWHMAVTNVYDKCWNEVSVAIHG